jgi:ribosomal protein S18 acetylase RimI-like enzyme
MQLDIHPVGADRWDDMVTLFERRGPRGGHRNTPAYGCWCMYWRDRSLEHGEPKKRAMAKLVRDGCDPGLLAYVGGEPVGWVSVAPRREFHALVSSPRYGPRDSALEAAAARPPAPGARTLRPPSAGGARTSRPPSAAGGDEGVWSIVCFVVDRLQRRSGVAGALLDAAVAHAFARGAAAVEAYPHVSNGADYMGPLALFERAGFKTVRDANKRAIVRRER